MWTRQPPPTPSIFYPSILVLQARERCLFMGGGGGLLGVEPLFSPPPFTHTHTSITLRRHVEEGDKVRGKEGGKGNHTAAHLFLRSKGQN